MNIVQNLNIKKGLYICISLFLFSSFIACAQNAEELSGIMRIGAGKGTSYTYMIRYNKDSLGRIKGYSIFNSGGKQEVKTLISGSFILGKLEFKEYKILSNKSGARNDEMCYVHYLGETKKIMKAEMISGKFSGYYQNGKPCGEGSITFANRQKMFAKLDSAVRDKKKDTQIKSENMAFAQVIPIHKSDDSKTTIEWKSDSLIFSLWDQDKVDNDKVSLWINGKIVHNNMRLSDNPFMYNSLFDKELTIEIKALNTGFFPPNTSKLAFRDGKEKYYFINNLNKDKSAYYHIIKK